MSTWLIIWLVVLVVMIIIELCTTGLLAIWLAGGAACAAIIAAFELPIWLQIIVCAVVTFLLYAFVRPRAKKYFRKNKEKLAATDMIGKRGFVSSEIDNLRGIGQVKIDGREWAARSVEENVVVPEGAIVNVVSVRGPRLVVELDESMIDNLNLQASDATLDPRYIEQNPID